MADHFSKDPLMTDDEHEEEGGWGEEDVRSEGNDTDGDFDFSGDELEDQPSSSSKNKLGIAYKKSSLAPREQASSVDPTTPQTRNSAGAASSVTGIYNADSSTSARNSGEDEPVNVLLMSPKLDAPGTVATPVSPLFHVTPMKLSPLSSYDPKFMDELLYSGRNKGSKNVHWNLLFQGSFFTNAAGGVGNADLPRAQRLSDGQLIVPSMYVKDIVMGANYEEKSLKQGEKGTFTLPNTMSNMSFRKFKTEPISLDGLFLGCRGFKDGHRLFIHPTVGPLEASVLVHMAVNNADKYELAMPKEQIVELANFVKLVNRQRAYASCEIAHIGGEWYAAQRLEVLGHEEKTGYAEIETKGKGFMGGQRYKNDYIQSRRVGSCRSGQMLEEYGSQYADLSVPVKVTHIIPLSWNGQEPVNDGTPYLKVPCKSTDYKVQPSTEVDKSASHEKALRLKKPFYGQILTVKNGQPLPILDIAPGNAPSEKRDHVLRTLGAEFAGLDMPDIVQVNRITKRKLEVCIQSVSKFPEDDNVLSIDMIAEEKERESHFSVIPLLGIAGVWYNLYTLVPHMNVPFLCDEDSYVLRLTRNATMEGFYAGKADLSIEDTVRESRSTTDADEPRGPPSVRRPLISPTSPGGGLVTPRKPSSHSLADDVSSLGSAMTGVTGPQKALKTTVTYSPDGAREEIVEFQDGSTMIRKFPASLAEASPNKDEAGVEVSLGDASAVSSARPSPPGSSFVPPSGGSVAQTGNVGEETLRFTRYNSVQNTLHIDVGGEEGMSGVDGLAGADGTQPGERGQNGRHASQPKNGSNSRDMVLELRREMALEAEEMVALTLTVTTPRKATYTTEERYPLKSLPKIFWSATGGQGGHGGSGGDGGSGAIGRAGKVGAMLESEATGGPGGDGGHPGVGSCGAHGGNGGNVSIKVNKNDSFLLLAVEPRSPSTAVENLKGGIGGLPGKHGRGGAGGPGGPGSHILPPEGKKKKSPFKKRKSASIRGPDGVPGQGGSVQSMVLSAGRQGRNGTFVIDLEGAEFQGAFDLKLAGLRLEGNSMIDEGIFEFGTDVNIKNVSCKNTGMMPIPVNQAVRFGLSEFDTQILRIVDTPEPLMISNVSNDIEPGEVAMSTGVLSISSNYPEKDDLDFDAVEVKASFKLAAHMMHLPLTFNDTFPRFHAGKPAEVCFKFPLQNSDGILGLKSVCPDEAVSLTFSVKNISLDDVGEKSAQRRALRIHFAEETDCNGKLHSFSAVLAGQVLDDHQSVTSVRRGSLTGNGTVLNVPLVGAGKEAKANLDLLLGTKSRLYARTHLQANILLQCGTQLKVIQRRRLTMVCEPKYLAKKDVQAVLVTSRATTLKQYDAWMRLLKSMGLSSEVYSLSRYSCLDPEFEPVKGTNLRKAFSNKLVILLNDDIPMTEGDGVIKPLGLYSRGCMEQSSGFGGGTRWLLVDRSDHITSHHLDLLLTPSLTTATKVEKYKNLSSFKSTMQVFLGNEMENGRILKDDMQVCAEIPLVPGTTRGFGNNHVKDTAASLSEWLTQQDTLRHHTVIYATTSSGSVARGSPAGMFRVYRGVCKSRNSAMRVFCENVQDIESQSIRLAVAEALPRELRVERYCAGLRSGLEENSLEAFELAITAELIREVLYLVDAELNVSDEMEDCYMTLGSLTDNLDVLELIRDCKVNDEISGHNDLKNIVADRFSRLIGRLEAVAQSKDLRPKINANARNKKKSILTALVDSVQRLRRQWRFVYNPEISTKTFQSVKDRVRQRLGGEAERVGSNWLRGLLQVHSTSGINDSVVARPLVDFAQHLQRLVAWEQFDMAKATIKARRKRNYELARRTARERAHFTHVGEIPILDEATYATDTDASFVIEVEGDSQTAKDEEKKEEDPIIADRVAKERELSPVSEARVNGAEPTDGGPSVPEDEMRGFPV